MSRKKCVQTNAIDLILSARKMGEIASASCFGFASQSARNDEAGTSRAELLQFYKMARESRLGEKQLSYYSNAYETAGESGVKALSYRKRIPAEIREIAMEKINTYFYNRVPLKLRSEIGFFVKAQYNRITALEKRPLFSDPSRASCVEFVQFRYTDYDKRWHLYWMRKFNKWWPYVPRKPVYTIDDCIEVMDVNYFSHQ